MSDELKPCPFCGSCMIDAKKMEDGGYAVFCNDELDFYYRSDCGASVGDISYGSEHCGCGENKGDFETKQEAIKAWNTRTQPPQQGGRTLEDAKNHEWDTSKFIKVDIETGETVKQGGDVGEALAGMEKAIYKLRGLEAEPMYKDQRLVSSVWAIRDDKIEPIEQDLKFYMDKIRTHLTQAQEQREWLPIESAPRDGVSFLLRKVYPEITEHWTCRYEPPEEYTTQDGVEYEGHAWILNDGASMLLTDGEDAGYEWQTLPTPPAATITKAEG